MMEEDLRAHADKVGSRLASHKRWNWVPGLVFLWHGRHLIVVKITAYDTVYGIYLGDGTGFEFGIQEHHLTPDLLNPITTGVLFDMWAKEAHYASIQADRYRLVGPPPERRKSMQKMKGAWTLVVDTGSQIQAHSEDNLEVVAAEALLGLWNRYENLTPARIKAAPLPDVPHD